MTLNVFYRKEFFLVLDSLISHITEKRENIVQSFTPFLVLNPNKMPSIDDVENFRDMFPREIPSSEMLFSELELFILFVEKQTQEGSLSGEISYRSAADLAIGAL